MVDISACRLGRLPLVAETRLEMGAHVVVDTLEFFLLEIVAVAADLGTTHLVGIGIVAFTRLQLPAAGRLLANEAKSTASATHDPPAGPSMNSVMRPNSFSGSTRRSS